MLRVIGLIIAAGMLLVSFQVDAQTMSLQLAANESKSITNNYMWTINATCSIETSDSIKKIHINVVKNHGKVNGKNLANGQSTSIQVHNKDNISVSADPGAKITLQNSSQESVKATCSG